jgi:two-component system sensor histidine kinase ChiS
MAAALTVGKRILIIDDDITTQEMMSTVLAYEGYRVAAARDGSDGIDRLLAYEKPDLILLDLRMPGMDGAAFCHTRKQNIELAAIPLVVLSAADDVAEQATALGAAGYLRKPVDTVLLLNTLRQHCRLKAAAEAAGR